MNEFNQRPFTQKQGSRLSAFEEEEKFALSPMPTASYKMSEWKSAKVRPDYHISVESMFYSVPYEYINLQVEVRLTQISSIFTLTICGSLLINDYMANLGS